MTSALEEATAEFQSLKAVADTLGEVAAGVSAVIYGVSAVQAFQRNDTFSGIVDEAQTAASVAALAALLAGQPELAAVIFVAQAVVSFVQQLITGGLFPSSNPVYPTGEAQLAFANGGIGAFTTWTMPAAASRRPAC